jgi:riboflavin transporter FmnP
VLKNRHIFHANISLEGKEGEMKNLQTTFEMIGSSTYHFIALIVLIIAAFAVGYIFEKLARRKENETERSSEGLFNTRKIAIIGVFSAISFVLMLFEFPLPFAPSFYKFDFSDIPALIGGFAAGPMVGVMIEFIKVVLNILIQGPTPGFVGEIANFVVGSAFIIPATVIYRFHKTRKSALISCIAGTLTIALVGSALNAFFLLPAYAIAYGVDIDYFVAAGTAINPAISNVFTFCALAVAPFNLLKGTADSILTFLVYKQLSPILKGNNTAVRKVVKAEEA